MKGGKGLLPLELEWGREWGTPGSNQLCKGADGGFPPGRLLALSLGQGSLVGSSPRALQTVFGDWVLVVTTGVLLASTGRKPETLPSTLQSAGRPRHSSSLSFSPGLPGLLRKGRGEKVSIGLEGQLPAC